MLVNFEFNVSGGGSAPTQKHRVRVCHVASDVQLLLFFHLSVLRALKAAITRSGSMMDSSIEPAKRPIETINNAETLPSKRPKSGDTSEVTERRRLEKEHKEAEKQLLRQRKELERKAAKKIKEAERLAEKNQKELERKADKERREAEKLAEKAKKEAEKLLEKQRKEAEKAAEKEKKDAEKLAAKEKKEMELLKAQPKINLFFKASPYSVPSSQSVLEPVADAQTIAPNSSDKGSDYQRYILPFHVKQNGHLYSGISNYTCANEAEPTMNCRDWLLMQKLKGSTAKNSTSTSRNKLTSQQFRTHLALAQESSEVANLLKQIRIRRLQFSYLSPKCIEDPSAPVNQEYRPPYVGSVRDLDEETLRALAVNPFRIDLLQEMLYEYDSEVEWDNDDGEDLREDDGDDSDEDQEDQEELREFLSSDDDDTSSPKKPRFLGPLTAVVIWGDDPAAASLDNFAIELFDGPITPLKGVVDATEEKNSSQTEAATKSDKTRFSPSPLSSMLDQLEKKVGQHRLKESLLSHNGSTGTKTLIVELLKQQLSGATAQEIRILFDSCVERVGKKRAEKKWVLNSKACEYFSIPYSEVASQGVSEAMQPRQTTINIPHYEMSI